MRVKPTEGSDGDPPDTPTSTTTSTASTTVAYNSMGYTGASGTPANYNQPFPSFFDLLDSPDAEEDVDSPMPAELEEEFLEMLAGSDMATTMYGPPPYPGNSGYQTGYPSFQNQYMGSYPPYANYAGYPVNGAAVNGAGQVAGQPVVKQEPQQNVKATAAMEMDTSESNAASPNAVYVEGEKLISALEAATVKNQTRDPLQTIAVKVGITGSENEVSDDGGSSRDGDISSGNMMQAGSMSSEASPAPALSPSSTTSSRSTKRSRTTALSAEKRKISPSSSSRATQPKKSVLVPVEVPEEILYEEAKSKPIRHRKEPDVVESKDRSVRNAINARVNRQKHKLYVDGLEAEIDTLKETNHHLEERHNDSMAKMAEMQKHIKYLENVIANDITISKVLTSVGSIEGVQMTSSFARKRTISADTTTTGGDQLMGGVCLHVDKNNVSIEFCEKCAEKARLSRKAAS